MPNQTTMPSSLPLQNLKRLRNVMKEHEIAVTVFRFVYKQQHYFVSVCLLTEEDCNKKDAEYALVRLCFMREENLAEYLDCYANSKQITAGLTELRRFLGVEYQPDGIGWLAGFYKDLGREIPEELSPIDANMQRVVVHTICLHENRNPNRTFRSHMFRNGKDKNGKQKHRTEYNGQLASIKFPQIYQRFKNEKQISFAFTEHAEHEKDESEVLANFEINEQKRN